MEQATGCRIWNRTWNYDACGVERESGPSQNHLPDQPPQSSPEQICLAVGGIQARALFGAGRRILRWLWHYRRFEAGER
jgi:hypothetical protein